MEYRDIMHNEELLEFTIERLEELKGYYTGYGSDLHDEVFNRDYYIIGRYQATQWLGDKAFEAIGIIKDYEELNIGELYTDISEPEHVVNMYTCIAGEVLMSLSDHLQNECFDRYLTEEDFDLIIEDLRD